MWHHGFIRPVHTPVHVISVLPVCVQSSLPCYKYRGWLGWNCLPYWLVYYNTGTDTSRYIFGRTRSGMDISYVEHWGTVYMGASTSTSEDSDKHLIQKVKIALVGTYAVGKTSIITRYIRDTFTSDYIYTRGKIKKTTEGRVDNLVSARHIWWSTFLIQTTISKINFFSYVETWYFCFRRKHE